MRVFLLFLVCFPSLVIAQPYQLSYDTDDVPELYNDIKVYVSNLSEDEEKVARNKKLYFNNKVVKNNQVTFGKKELYEAEGKLSFTLKTNGEEIPLSLELPILDYIRFNLYTDSIKPVLDYYLNIEGIFTSGKVYPLDTSIIRVSSSQGHMEGTTWVKPEVVDFDHVTFTAICKYNPAIARAITVYIKQGVDPRDQPDYEEE